MLLEVGMVIYCHLSLPEHLEKLTITKVTAKQAVVEYGKYEDRFDREVRSGSHFHAKGSSQYSRTSYTVATPELDAKYYRQQLSQRFSKVNISTLTNSQLERMFEITKEVQNVK